MADAKLHRTRNEIESFLPNIAGSPKDNATVELIVVRPAHGERSTLNAQAGRSHNRKRC